MYRRPYIREGDSLTPGGGLVKPKPQKYPSTYDGKLACYEGDPVYCNTCKSWGATKCVLPYRPDTDPEGRQANLDGDLCICRCPTPPRLKALFDSVSMGFEGYELAAMPGAILWRAYAGHEIEEHEIVYEVVDAKTGSPVEGMRYKLTDGGRTLLDSEALENGATRPYSISAHPNLSFVAWIKGDNK